MDYKSVKSVIPGSSINNLTESDYLTTDINDSFVSLMKNQNYDNSIESLSLYLNSIVNYIEVHKQKLDPILPPSFEYFFADLLNKNEKAFGSDLYQILSFFSTNKEICERFIKINILDKLVQNLSHHVYDQFNSKFLVVSIFNISDFLLTKISLDEFTSKYSLKVFVDNNDIDSIDLLNFLVLFSKHCSDFDFAKNIIITIKNKTLILFETSSQIAWIMFYLTRNKPTNSCLFFENPIFVNTNDNIFFVLSNFLIPNGNDQFFNPFFQFCYFFLTDQKVNESFMEKFFQSGNPYRTTILEVLNIQMITEIAANSHHQNVKKMILKILNYFLKLNDIPFPNDRNFVQTLFNIHKNGNNEVFKQLLILFSRIVYKLSLELVEVIFHSHFFLDAMDGYEMANFIPFLHFFFAMMIRLQTNSLLYEEFLTFCSEIDILTSIRNYIDSNEISDEDINMSLMLLEQAIKINDSNNAKESKFKTYLSKCGDISD
ncbi:hypothetical protein TRFO_09804 [Tritrichomonas foetus]|uniref:Uncharacterized protein n=1 Tax=Tritrichomonas foetus TaxID=1144522 RepID=A0A1J4JED7_9EUKA|nr:hypothetical protein TRFO_09804 [Tritrichomonas foetus]|eukprot:OHS96655.1 hypothetical protein TRFO_09804 [Tritrichomonas foetus]